MKRIVNLRAYVVLVLCAATAIGLHAQTLTSIFSFGGANGAYPSATLIQGTDGNFYGTATSGGGKANPNYNVGNVFKITPSGTFTTLYFFCIHEGRCLDGADPQYSLVQARNGDLYGTTRTGGAQGSGTVFKIGPTGVFTTLHSFCNGCLTDGQTPTGLTIASHGDLYGTTSGGGENGHGTVFKITPAGRVTQLYSFCSQSDCTDGAYPMAGLIQAANGDFYGTTADTPTGLCPSGPSCGTIFKITVGGTLTTLYTFCSQSNCTDGASPGALVQAGDGDFYGTTFYGGTSNQGTVFRTTPTGTLTTLHNFCSHSACADGYFPSPGLVHGTDGNFYGTTAYGGGAFGTGTVFRITASGALTTLHTFDKSDGATPFVGLLQGTNGAFYGTTLDGGSLNLGTLFSLSVGLGPFVEPRPASGTVGESIEILGTNLAGATRITFNGIAARVQAASNSVIVASVPAAATSGKIEVVTPAGTLSSNVPFRVLP